MKTHTNVDDAISVDGHTAEFVTADRLAWIALHCQECETHLVTEQPGRWREHRLAKAWQQHLIEVGAA